MLIIIVASKLRCIKVQYSY